MIKLSTTLTLSLLLGSTLSAASTALQITDGSLTPRSAANAWIAEKASGKKPTQSASKIHEALYTAAMEAINAADPERVIELLQTQRNFSIKSKVYPLTKFANYTISGGLVFMAIKAAFDTTDPQNIDRLLELFNLQETFSKSTKLIPFVNGTDYTIYPKEVLIKLRAAFDELMLVGNKEERLLELFSMQDELIKKRNHYHSEVQKRSIEFSEVEELITTALMKQKNPERIVSICEAISDFCVRHKASDLKNIKQKFRTNYEATKKELEKARSLVPAATTATTANTSTSASVEMSVQK
jgi:hypothetical protein